MFGLEDSLLQDMMLADTSPNPDRGLIPVARPHWGNSARSRSINFNQALTATQQKCPENMYGNYPTNSAGLKPILEYPNLSIAPPSPNMSIAPPSIPVPLLQPPPADVSAAGQLPTTSKDNNKSDTIVKYEDLFCKSVSPPPSLEDFHKELDHWRPVGPPPPSTSNCPAQNRLLAAPVKMNVSSTEPVASRSLPTNLNTSLKTPLEPVMIYVPQPIKSRNMSQDSSAGKVTGSRPSSRLETGISLASHDRTADSKSVSDDSQIDPNPRFKTEICRNFKEKGSCLYGDECQFAHGHQDIREVGRQNKYKTKLCQKYWISGYCAYGPRCNFVHQEEPTKDKSASSKVSDTIETIPKKRAADVGPLTIPKFGSGRLAMFKQNNKLGWFDIWTGTVVH